MSCQLTLTDEYFLITHHTHSPISTLAAASHQVLSREVELFGAVRLDAQAVSHGLYSSEGLGVEKIMIGVMVKSYIAFISV